MCVNPTVFEGYPVQYLFDDLILILTKMRKKRHINIRKNGQLICDSKGKVEVHILGLNMSKMRK